MDKDMKNKEAIEQLAQYIFAYKLVRPSIPEADALAQKLYELGYRKISGKPPMLSDEEMLKAMQSAYEFTSIVQTDIDKGVKAIIQAQCDADMRYYEGE